MNGQEQTAALSGKGEPEYLTGEQVASLLQCSVKSVQRWASHDPSMPVLRIGRTVRFPRERLLRWLKTREQGRGRGAQSLELLPSRAEPLDTQGNAVTSPRLCAHS